MKQQKFRNKNNSIMEYGIDDELRNYIYSINICVDYPITAGTFVLLDTRSGT